MGHPDAGAHQGVEVDPVLDTEPVEQPHQILGG
jgi:hypothetical protein